MRKISAETRRARLDWTLKVGSGDLLKATLLPAPLSLSPQPPAAIRSYRPWRRLLPPQEEVAATTTFRSPQSGATPSTVSFVFVAAAPGSDKKLPALTSFAPAVGGGFGVTVAAATFGSLYKAMRPRLTGTMRAFHPSPFPSARACIIADAAPTNDSMQCSAF